MNSRNALFIVLLLILTLAVQAGCAKKESPDPMADATMPSVTPPREQTVDDAEKSAQLKDALAQMRVEVKQKRRTYLIGPGDILRVKVWMREDLSKEGVVRDDGSYFIPLAGNLQAQGITVTEFQAKATEALAEYLRDPQVDAEILEYKSKFYYLVGQIREPGRYPVTATTTVMEAISVSKGFTDKANLGQAYLIHEEQIVPVDFVALFHKGRMENNLHLDDGDVIYIPSTDYARVYVLGEVLRPAAVAVRTGRISLAEAIADAGGFNETTAYKSEIRIIRGSLSDPQVFTVNFADVIKGKAPHLAFLQPGDIVYVPSTGLAKWDRTMGQIFPHLSRIVVDAAAINAMTSQ